MGVDVIKVTTNVDDLLNKSNWF